MSDEAEAETPRPVTGSEAIFNTFKKLPERTLQAIGPINLSQSREVVDIMGGIDAVKPGAELEPDFLSGFEIWERMAVEGRDKGGVEFFTNLILEGGKITPDKEKTREGWERLSPIGVLSGTAERVIGTVHTHPGESFFSPLDLMTFLARGDIVMAMVNSAGDISLMVKTRIIPLDDKAHVFRKFLSLIRRNLKVITRRNRIESEEEIYWKAREQVRFILDSARQLGIVVIRKEKESDRFKVAE